MTCFVGTFLGVALGLPAAYFVITFLLGWWNL
jgi:hypothetical protein